MWFFQPLLPGAAQQLSDPNAVSLTESASAGHSQSVTVIYGLAITEPSSATDEMTIPVPRSFFTADSTSTDVRCIRHADDSTYVSAQGHPSGASYGAFVTSGTRAFLCGYGADATSDNLIDSLNCSTEVWTDETIALASQRGQPAGASGPSHGIIIGGMNTSSTRYTSVEKLTYSTKTVGTHSGSLAVADAAISGMQSSTKGYVTKRFAGSAVGVRAFTFSDDTAATLSYATANYGAAATSSATAGYLWGGRSISSDVHWGYITRLDFATETDDTNHVYSNFNYQAGAGDSGRGYAVGGALSGTNTDMIAKCTYATGTYSLPSIYLGSVRPPTAGVGYLNASAPPQAAGQAESATASHSQTGPSGYDTGCGYVCGGGVGYVKKFAFTTEALTDTTASVGTSTHQGASRSGTHGYFAGRTGVFGYGKKFQISNETVDDLSMNVDKYCRAGLTSGAKGYYAGGDNSGGTRLDSVETVVFSNDSLATLSGTLDSIKTDMAQGIESTTSGFVAGSDGYTSVIETVLFSTEAVGAIAATLNTGRSGAASVKSSSAAYFVGGYTGSNSSEIDGIIFSTEAATNPAAFISPANGFMVGVSSALRGYVFGVGDYTYNFHFQSETIEHTASIAGTVGYRATSINNSVPASSIQSADRTEGATAGHSNDSGVTSSSSLTETASAGHANTVIGTFNPALVESSPATHINAAAATFVASAAEAASADHSNSGAAAMPSARSEPTTATDAPSAENLLGATRTEAATGGDSTNSLVTQEVARSESATGTESVQAALLVVANRSESATSSEVNTALLSAIGAASESASATNAQDVIAAFVSTASESANATATHNAAQLFLYQVTITDAAVATDTPSGAVSYPAAMQQAGSAVDFSTVLLTMVSAISDSASATDSPSVAATMPAAISEPSSATESQLASSGNSYWVIEAVSAGHTDTGGVLTSASRSEPAAAIDLASQGTAIADTRTEAASAADSVTVIRVVVSYGAETASATATHGASVVFSAADIAAASAATSQGVIASFSVIAAEQGGATDDAVPIGVFLLTHRETASASDFTVAGSVIERAIVEAAIAVATQLGLKIGDERVYRIVARVFGQVGVSVIARMVRVSARAETEAECSARSTTQIATARVQTSRKKARFIME